MGDRVPRRGATTVEYAIMLMLISLASILVISALGWRLAGIYDSSNAPIYNAITTPEDGAAPGAPGSKSRGPVRRGNPGQGNGGNDKGVGNGAGGGTNAHK
jgi:Flp pilus assembly pilin Flp